MTICTITSQQSSRTSWQRQCARGFTLVELMLVIIIIGIIAAIAVPKYIAVGTQARVAAVKTLASALITESENVHTMCKLDPNCDYNLITQYVTIGGRLAQVNYGYLDAGSPGLSQNDAWVNTSGFAVTGDGSNTYYRLNDSPTPAACSVSYIGGYLRGPVLHYGVTTDISGC